MPPRPATSPRRRTTALTSALLVPGLGVPLLGVSLLVVPGAQAALRDVAGLVQPADLPATRSVAVQQPGTGRRASRGWQTLVTGAAPPATVSSGTIGRAPATAAQGVPGRPLPLAPPAPPAFPAAVPRPAATASEVPEPPVTLGPVRRLRRTVAPGAGVPLPAGTGVAHVLCSGPGAPRATYWLDDSGTGTTVHRADGSGTYDLYYRWAGRSYRQTGACS